MRSSWLVVFLLMCTFTVFGQVRLSGEVTGKDAALDGVTIKVVQDGKVLRTLAVNRRGKYETEIPFGKTYVLTFTRSFMFPVSIAIDTRMFEDLEETIYDVPLNMTMFHRFDGMDEEEFKAVIGTIKKTGMGDDAFSFVPNVKVLSALKPLQVESRARFEKGEQPLESPLVSTDIDATPMKTELSDSKSEVLDPSTPPVNPLEPSTREAQDESKEETLRMDEQTIVIAAQKRHHEMTVDVHNMNRDNKQSNWEDQRASNARNEAHVKQEFVRMNQAQQKLAEEAEEEKVLLANARVAKQQRLNNMGVNGATLEPADRARIEVLDYRIDEGVWLTKEHLLVREGSDRVEYVRAKYDWFFFKEITCSRNGKEIAEQEYDRIKERVDF